MTWDLFLLDKFFENWVNKSSHEEFIYASNDKPLKQVLEMAIAMQINNNGSNFGSDLPISLIDEFNHITERMTEIEGRSISTVTDFKLFRDKLINEYEKVLL